MGHLRRGWLRLAVGLLGAGAAGLVAAQDPPPAKAPDHPQPLVTIEPPPGTILKDGELPIDLGTALRLAGAQNPELLLARERVSEAIALRQLAVAQLLPNINVGTNYDLHRGPLQQSNGNVLRVNRDALYYGFGTGAVGAGTISIPGLNYNLNVGEAWFGALQARQLVAERRFGALAVRNDVLLRVSLAYLDLQRADARRAIAVTNRDEGAEVARLTAVYAARKVQQGRKADADRAAVELKRRDAELTQAEGDVLTASARLARELNLDPSARLKPVEGWAVPAPLVPDTVPLSELIAVALVQRPELAERRTEIRRALYALSAARLLPFSPNVVLGFSAGGFGGGSDLVAQGVVAANGQVTTGPRFGDFGGRSDFDVAVYWTVRNLGVGNVALVREARSVVRQTQLRELETLNRVRAEVAESYARSAARAAQIDAAEKAVRAAREAFSEDLLRIRGFFGLPIELMDSMRLLGRARYEYLDAIVEYNRAQFQLYVALGRPPADMLARPVPAELGPPVAVPLPGRTLPPGSAPPGPRLLAPPRLPGPGVGP